MPPDRTRLAIARAIRLSVKNGLSVAPEEEWDQLLWAKFDGNVFEINETIAYYDEDDDELVINPTHLAWSNMIDYIRADERRGHFSTRSADHIIRHEIGHALHYRGMTDAERAEIWYKELTSDEEAIAKEVGRYALTGRVEFVAEVFAGLWARRKLSSKILALYANWKGPPR